MIEIHKKYHFLPIVIVRLPGEKSSNYFIYIYFLFCFCGSKKQWRIRLLLRQFAMPMLKLFLVGMCSSDILLVVNSPHDTSISDGDQISHPQIK